MTSTINDRPAVTLRPLPVAYDVVIVRRNDFADAALLALVGSFGYRAVLADVGAAPLPACSLGTLIGSNITNPLVAIGLGAIVSTYDVPRPLVAYDLPWATVSGAMLLGYLLWRKGRIGRWGAVYFVVMYALYITFRALFFAVD